MTAQTATVHAIAYHAALSIPQLRGGKVIASLMAKHLRAMKPMRADVDAMREQIAAAYETLANMGPDRESMNTLLHELYAWANIEIGGKRVCRVSMF